ncbi:AAA family ATPase [Sphingomonas sp. BK580]|uniref:AAA family ATPase n=1 Tax=Sphingomonas sp. BK580 TaxID=2586972 RepID=UPI00160B8F17|nr:AAA family ATPase [Sphingomonas sp. BK580]MBB3692463.1 putative ATPase [Sphingomonas sp. BK580]
MELRKFDILNFKGISKTSIDITEAAPGNVSTLIGLNESGKTTILEALSHFITEDKDTANLVSTVQQKSALQDLIPKDRKAAFTGHVSIRATITFDESEVRSLAEHFSKAYGLVLDESAFNKTITVARSYEFADSKHLDTSTFWTIFFDLRGKRQKKFTNYDGGRGDADKRAIWLSGIRFLSSYIPKIVYFPTFLFDFPDRIYLTDQDSEINDYYVQVIQDVLDSQGEGLNVERHIIQRIAALKSEHPTVATFMAFVFGRDEKKQVDAVLQKASNEMSRVIFGSWNQILGRNFSGKRVQVDWLLDAERDNVPYLEVYIVDGQSKYSLSERSLGFRWFFSFLLFTQFRKNRADQGGTIFLFDEPAANLHSRAQMKLLESFARIAHGDTHIIYSTHSHYMVNPLWLEKSYIIENLANNYDDEDDVDAFSTKKTDVRAVKYRTFVGNNSTKTTYFQPVLDALEVPISPLLGASKAVIVEGKYDYHPFYYLYRRIKGDSDIKLFPANGASSLPALISLFRGWGVKFVVILDDDQAGRRSKKRYVDELMLKDDEVATLGDIDRSLENCTSEAIYKGDLRSASAAHFGVGEVTKRQLALFFQEEALSQKDRMYAETEKAFHPIADWIVSRLDAS